VKLAVCVLAILSPVLGRAQLAGDWAGLTTDSQGAHRIALHISGPFTAMKATANIPGEKVLNAPVESITFLESTLEFSIPASDIRYSGVLNDNGAIVGTLTQHGASVPLVLARVAPELPEPVPAPGGIIENGRYHDKITAIEFDVPSNWVVSRAERSPDNRGGLTTFQDGSGKATVATVNMAKVALSPEAVLKLLDLIIPHQIAMRDGQAGEGPVHTASNYKIRDGSVDKTYIGGHPAIRAIGDFELGDKKFSEALAWIITEHTRTYFMVRGAAENLPSLQASLDSMLQSLKVP
jgi:hypothetical protein